MGIVSLKDATNLVRLWVGIVALPKFLSKVQNEIFSTHVRVEELMNQLIAIKTLSSFELNLNEENLDKIKLILEPVLGMGFYRKLKYIKDKDYLDSKDIEEINELNNFRVEFAHKSREYLIKRYYGPTNRKKITDIRKALMSAPLSIQVEISNLTGLHYNPKKIEDEEIPF